MLQRALYAGVMLFNGKFVFDVHIYNQPSLCALCEGVCVCVESKAGLVADGGVVNQPRRAPTHTKPAQHIGTRGPPCVSADATRQCPFARDAATD
jgi:hypothetical protein